MTSSTRPKAELHWALWRGDSEGARRSLADGHSAIEPCRRFHGSELWAPVVFAAASRWASQADLVWILEQAERAGGLDPWQYSQAIREAARRDKWLAVETLLSLAPENEWFGYVDRLVLPGIANARGSDCAAYLRKWLERSRNHAQHPTRLREHLFMTAQHQRWAILDVWLDHVNATGANLEKICDSKFEVCVLLGDSEAALKELSQPSLPGVTDRRMALALARDDVPLVKKLRDAWLLERRPGHAATGILVEAAGVAAPKVLAWALECGADPNRPFGDSDSAIWEALAANQAQQVAALLRAGAMLTRTVEPDEDDPTSPEEVSIVPAAAGLESIEVLMQFGVPLHGFDEEGNSLLIEAAALDDVQRVNRLLEAGAEVNDSAPNFGRTALHTAASMESWHSMVRLIEAGADPNHVDSGGDAPLDLACSWHTHAYLRSLGARTAKELVEGRDSC